MITAPSFELIIGSLVQYGSTRGIVVAIDQQAGLVDIAPICDQVKAANNALLEISVASEVIMVDCAHLVSCARDVVQVQGQLDEAACDTILRATVRVGIERYYVARHQPAQQKPFTPGDRITYAGRVFDEQEMLKLGDSMLDFWLTTGRFSDEFERRFAQKLGVRFAALVNSGSSANLIAFSALTSPLLGDRAIRAGDEVITVAAGFPTTVTPVLQNQCVPVFVDITVDDGTYNIDTSLLEGALSNRTRAIMVAHTLGNPINLDAVVAFCKQHNLWLVEDNCDALGSTYHGQLTGTFGDLATSSFYPPHHMTMGEGGAVYAKSLQLKRAVESFRDWGRDCWCPAGKDNTCGKRFCQTLGDLPPGYDHKYVYSHAGFNLKVTDMQAAIGLAQLDKIDSFIAARRANWQALREQLSSLEDVFILPEPTKHADPSWFGFLLTIRDTSRLSRTKAVEFLESKNIQTRMLFAGNLTRQPFLATEHGRSLYRTASSLVNTDRAMTDTFWVGVYPGLKPGMIEYTAQVLHELVGRRP